MERPLERLRGICLALPETIERFWEEIAELVEDAYRMVAPKKLITELDARRYG